MLVFENHDSKTCVFQTNMLLLQPPKFAYTYTIVASFEDDMMQTFNGNMTTCHRLHAIAIKFPKPTGRYGSLSELVSPRCKCHLDA